MNALLPGTEVEARGLRWEVVFTQLLGTQRLVRLRGLDGALRGEEQDLLEPFEPIRLITHDLRPEHAGPFTNWLVYHQAFLLEQALGADALLAVQPGRLRVEPYQLVPVLRALRMSRVRLLLADSVGLGKTVQAGLVLTELIARRIAHRILIVSPAGPLLQQWRTEMLERFGLRLDELDRPRLEEIRRSTELGANPFDSVPLGIVSMDFIKQERVLEQLDKTSYDVVVIDEAHHVTDAGGQMEREDSLRRRLAEVLARRCDALILATATPHDGNDRSFASLCELLDPSLVDGRGVLRGDAYRGHVIRRLKRHIVDPVTGEQRFRERVVHPIAVRADTSKHRCFIAMQRALLELVAPELRRAFRQREYAEVLSYIALLKRSVSTVEACASTLEVIAGRRQRLLTDDAESQETRRERLRSLKALNLKVSRFGTTTAAEEEERAQLEAEDLEANLRQLAKDVRSGSRKLNRAASVVEALDEIVALAADAREADPKIDQLVAEIREIRRKEPHASVLVYTEYQASQRAAVKVLECERVGTVLTMCGDDDETVRGDVTRKFRTEDGLVLVSTDAAAEGLNLHQKCHHLIHLELPFNPNRLEQRNGRIDRYGQALDPTVRYLYLAGTFEERILLRLIAKYERQRARLTFVPNTLGLSAANDVSGERLLKGLIDEDAKLFQEPQSAHFDFTSGPVEAGADDATREILEEIDNTLGGYEKAARTHEWLGTAGLNAEAALLAQADRARVTGGRATTVDLARFVHDAVLRFGGQAKGTPRDSSFELVLPPDWTHGLDETPGFEAATRTVRLTSRMEVERDAAGRAVGFLARAHPLVRRALDRVRTLSLGATVGEDPRIAGVVAPVAAPMLLCTFLARVPSRAGRELERVVAVRVTQSEPPEFTADAETWLEIIETARGTQAKGLWEATFASWAAGGSARALEAAKAGFVPIAAAFRSARGAGLVEERRDLQRWLAERAKELTTEAAAADEQVSLFDAPATQKATWRNVSDPLVRLSRFAIDMDQSPTRRSAAEGVLTIHKQRTAILDARAELGEPEVLPLGLLMVVPEASRGA